MKGIVSSVGNFPTYKDYDMPVLAADWTAATGGQDGYINTILAEDISQDLGITANTRFALIPQQPSTGYLGSFGKINAAESTTTTVEGETVGCIKLYALNEAPSEDIMMTLRVFWY